MKRSKIKLGISFKEGTTLGEAMEVIREAKDNLEQKEVVEVAVRSIEFEPKKDYGIKR